MPCSRSTIGSTISPTPSCAVGDLLLIKGILEQSPDEVTGEGDLYAGAAVLTMLYQAAVTNNHPELLMLVDVEQIIQGGVDRIEEGSFNPEPQEVAGFLIWLAAVGAPLVTAQAQVADASAPSPSEPQAILTDAAVGFVQDPAPPREDFVALAREPERQFALEKIAHGLPDWLGDAPAHPAVAALDSLAGKFSGVHVDFLL